MRYKDITKEWRNFNKTYNNKVIIDTNYIDDFGIKHPIKCKEKLHLTSLNSDEYKVALFLKDNFDGDIHLVPRITDISNTGLSTHT